MTYGKHWRGYHDLGGLPADEVQVEDRPLQHWEKRVHAMVTLLCDSKRNLLTMDQYRCGVESLGEDVYKKESYYARWCGAVANIMVEKGILTSEEIARKLAEIEEREHKHSHE